MKTREVPVLKWLLFRDITSLSDFSPSSNNYIGTICHAVTVEDKCTNSNSDYDLSTTIVFHKSNRLWLL